MKLRKSVIWLLICSLLLAFTACNFSSSDTEPYFGSATVGDIETLLDTVGDTVTPDTPPVTSVPSDPEPIGPIKPEMDPIQFDKENIQAMILSEDVVYRMARGGYRYNAWPSVIQDENGVLYSVWSGDRLAHICPFGKTLMKTSTDGGQTWSEKTVINQIPLDARDAGIVYLGNGRLLVTYFTHPAEFYLQEKTSILSYATKMGVYDEVLAKLQSLEAMTPKEGKGGSYIIISDDYGKSWGEPIQSPVTAPHGPILLESGELLYLGREHYSNKYGTGSIVLMSSKDRGETWSFVSSIATPTGMTVNNFWEPHLVQLNDGRLMAALRVQGVEETATSQFTIYLSFSSNGGRSWTKPAPTGISGSPAHLLKLSDGSIVMSYSRRESPCGIRAVISTDNGETWSDEIILSESHSGDLGYPCTVELADHTLVTVFYKLSGNDTKTSIYSVRWSLQQ